MNTDELIGLLATGNPRVPPHVLARRLVLALAAGGLGAVLLMASLYGVRPDLAEVARTPLFWAKLALPGVLLGVALVLVHRLARPGVKTGPAAGALLIPVALVWLGGALEWFGASAGDRTGLLFGTTWKTCALNIALLSLPALVANVWVLRTMNPTRLRATGAAGGLLAGATATLAYCLHCPEMNVTFWCVWYLAGMLLPTVLGAWLGPRLLRW
ncbi:hypothetical protein PF66_05885 [Pseudomonas asplenii]|uniref:Anti-sigma-F factor NrsF n=1 Tax=Pseudomonas asplenii TaxID=53407 RepID=A0A0N0VIB3_9PSED|nr:DUF1109 domain-containing protein [Pseudomonas fuscovaginae]KPA87665.1 hypothetical protein PF66_05885 [Pseudomonas fuscovaginae]